jgi:hypothetical protein
VAAKVRTFFKYASVFCPFFCISLEKVQALSGKSAAAFGEKPCSFCPFPLLLLGGGIKPLSAQSVSISEKAGLFSFPAHAERIFKILPSYE